MIDFSRKLKILIVDMPSMIRWYYFLFKFISRYEFNVLLGLSKSEKKRHHHIPQFLLNNFKISDGLIYRRNKNTCKSEKCSLRKQAGHMHEQYTFINKRTKKKDQFIEDFYAAIENETSPIIKKIIKEDLRSIDNFELNMLSHFVGSLILRNPVFREFMSLSLSFVVEKHYRGKSKKINEDFIRDVFIENNFDLERNELEKWASVYDNNKHEKLLNSSMILSNYLWSYIAKNIFCYNISIFDIRSEDEFFIISDNPVLFSDNELRPKLMFFPPIIFNDDTVIMLPINPKKCIVFSKIYKNKKVYDVNLDIVKRINALSLVNSPKYTYSDREESHFVSLYTKQRE